MLRSLMRHLSLGQKPGAGVKTGESHNPWTNGGAGQDHYESVRLLGHDIRDGFPGHLSL
jgi:hypothetical protein